MQYYMFVWPKIRPSPNRLGTFTGGLGDLCLAYGGTWGGVISQFMGRESSKKLKTCTAIVIQTPRSDELRSLRESLDATLWSSSVRLA